MDLFDYAGSARDVLAMLEESGAPVTLRQTTAGVHNPATGTVSETVTDHLGTGAVFGYRQDDIDGTLVKQGDQRLLLAVIKADGTPMPQPRTGDKLLMGASVYTVASAKVVAPAGVPVLFGAQLRGVTA